MSKCGKKSAIKKGLGNVQNSFPIIFDDFHLSTFEDGYKLAGLHARNISFIYIILANDDIPMSNFGLVCLQAKQSILTGDRIYHMLHI